MATRKTNYSIPTRREIIEKYGLTEKQFENLRRRTGERIKIAQILYKIPQSGTPKINQLIDYSLKEKSQKIFTFENILQAPASHRTKPSKQALRTASKNIIGRSSTPHNLGFDIFSQNILNFNIMKDNVEKAYTKTPSYEKVELWTPGVPFGSDPPYTIINSEDGRKLCREINSIWDHYNTMLETMTYENANVIYLQYTRLVMEKIDYGTKEGLIVGSL